MYDLFNLQMRAHSFRPAGTCMQGMLNNTVVVTLLNVSHVTDILRASADLQSSFSVNVSGLSMQGPKVSPILTRSSGLEMKARVCDID